MKSLGKCYLMHGAYKDKLRLEEFLDLDMDNILLENVSFVRLMTWLHSRALVTGCCVSNMLSILSVSTPVLSMVCLMRH